MQAIELDFHCYCREEKKYEIPQTSGIYCVYLCEYSKSRRNLRIMDLLYIGESENIHDQIVDNDRLSEWKKHLSDNQTVCYSYAKIDHKDRERAEAALVYKIKPEFNDCLYEKFCYADTEIKTCGYNAYLQKRFTVKRGR